MPAKRTNPVAHPLCAAALLAAALAGCRDEPPAESAGKPPVRVADVQADTFRRTVEGIGTLRAAQRVEIRPDAEGYIRKIRFERGQKVEADAVLVVLDAEELRDRLRATKAELAGAEIRRKKANRSFERIERLYEADTASIEELDQARADFEALLADERRLSAQIDLIGEQIEDTRIRAFVSGEISDHRVDVGDYVVRGDLLATLYSRSAMEVRFTVGQQAMGKVEPGQPVRLSVDAWPQRTFEGKVTYVAPAVLEATRELPVVAVLENPEGLLKPGAFATAELTIGVRRDVPTVPEEALVATRTGYEVFVVEDGKSYRRQVEIGLRKPGFVEIRKGLQVGEKIVRTGAMRLTDGAAVQIVAAGNGSEAKDASGPTQDGKASPTEGPKRPTEDRQAAPTGAARPVEDREASAAHPSHSARRTERTRAG